MQAVYLSKTLCKENLMPEQVAFGMEVFLNGLMAGVLYALVALGFVLIYKASGIFSTIKFLK